MIMFCATHYWEKSQFLGKDCNFFKNKKLQFLDGD